jgi:putative membrane protein insertion efficiency factor
VTLMQRVTKLPAWGLILGVRLYQRFIGPMLGQHCRFTPSCSVYFIEAVEKYGAIRGTWKGACRIGRCNPWYEGGHDPP